MAIAGFSAGGLFTALTIALFVLDRPKEPAAARAFRCQPNGFAALSCQTQF